MVRTTGNLFVLGAGPDFVSKRVRSV